MSIGLPYVRGQLHQLGPGDWVIGEAPGQIETLLGSCVSLTAWHPVMRIGAACHCLLPQRPADRRSLDPRYVEDAIALMIEALQRRGADPRRCQLQLFGGSRMFEGGATDIGERNVAEAERVLRGHGLAPSQRDTGGTAHRRIRLDLDSGQVLQRVAAAVAAPLLPPHSLPRSGAHG